MIKKLWNHIVDIHLQNHNLKFHQFWQLEFWRRPYEVRLYRRRLPWHLRKDVCDFLFRQSIYLHPLHIYIQSREDVSVGPQTFSTFFDVPWYPQLSFCPQQASVATSPPPAPTGGTATLLAFQLPSTSTDKHHLSQRHHSTHQRLTTCPDCT